MFTSKPRAKPAARSRSYVCRHCEERLVRRSSTSEGGSDEAIQKAVIPRACGVSSTPRPLDSTTNVSEYWIARLRGR